MLASHKARNRRSLSAHTITNNNSSASSKNQSLLNSTKEHLSRSKYRTPQTNRLQTMSADRSMNPVTPKIQANTPVAMFRYPKMGETVISLSGSPVIVQG